jgi:hypothetical protein
MNSQHAWIAGQISHYWTGEGISIQLLLNSWTPGYQPHSNIPDWADHLKSKEFLAIHVHQEMFIWYYSSKFRRASPHMPMKQVSIHSRYYQVSCKLVLDSTKTNICKLDFNCTNWRIWIWNWAILISSSHESSKLDLEYYKVDDVFLKIYIDKPSKVADAYHALRSQQRAFGTKGRGYVALTMDCYSKFWVIINSMLYPKFINSAHLSNTFLLSCSQSSQLLRWTSNCKWKTVRGAWFCI